MSTVSMTVNGKVVAEVVEDRTLLVDFIREPVSYTHLTLPTIYSV